MHGNDEELLKGAFLNSPAMTSRDDAERNDGSLSPDRIQMDETNFTNLSTPPASRRNSSPAFKKEFMTSVKNRNRERVSQLLQENPDLTTYTDDLGISALKRCVESRSIELMDVFIEANHVERERLEVINYGILYAIQSDDVNLVEHLLNRRDKLHAATGMSVNRVPVAHYPAANRTSSDNTISPKNGKEKRKKNKSHTWRSRQKSLLPALDNSADFSIYITPIILAAKLERHEIITLLVKREEVEIHPLSQTASERGYDTSHDRQCPLFSEGDCEICHERKVYMSRRKLEESKRMLEVYRAMSSPAYLFQADQTDPILECFYLSKEMEKMVEEDPSFTKEYRDIGTSCRQLASDILEQCRYDDEVKMLMTRIQGVKEVNSMGCTTGMSRVLVAIHYKQKEFIGHPHCQQYIEAKWYDGFPSWVCDTEYRRLALTFYLFLWLIGWPIMSLLFSFKISPNIIKTMKQPINKFITDTISFLIFLVLLGVNCWSYTVEDRTPDKLFGILEYLIIAWILGMSGRLLKMIYRHRHSCHSCGLRGGPEIRPLDAMLLIFFWLWIILKSVGIGWAYANGTEHWPRFKWPNYHPILISEAFYSLGVVLSFVRLSSLFKASRTVGPLQISLRKMLYDIGRFMLIFTIVMTGFVVAITTLYSHYENNTRYKGTYGDFVEVKTQGHELIGFQQVYRTLFWALFGYQEMEHIPDVVVDNKPRGNLSKFDPNEELPVIKHKFTEGVGYFLVGAYHIVAVIVLLNMLIAMMAKSYDTIEANSNIEWMFARTRLRMIYYSEVGALPPPFNVLPLGFIFKFFMKRMKHINYCCELINKYSFPESFKDDDQKYKDLIKKLAQRYWNKRTSYSVSKTIRSSEETDELGKTLQLIHLKQNLT